MEKAVKSMQENTKPMQEKIEEIDDILAHHWRNPTTTRETTRIALKDLIQQEREEANDAGYLQGLKEGTDIFNKLSANEDKIRKEAVKGFVDLVKNIRRFFGHLKEIMMGTWCMLFLKMEMNLMPLRIIRFLLRANGSQWMI